jgi:hypothetical protein
MKLKKHVLKRQTYRHVDGVQFESPKLLQPIIDFATGRACQRVAWLYGTYEQMPYVPGSRETKTSAATNAIGFPLGIRTIVKAVYVLPNPTLS